MKMNELDELDGLIIKSIRDQKKLVPSEIYLHISSIISRKISRAIVQSRLMGLVESGYLDLLHTDEEGYSKSEYVFTGKPVKFG